MIPIINFPDVSGGHGPFHSITHCPCEDDRKGANVANAEVKPETDTKRNEELERLRNCSPIRFGTIKLLAVIVWITTMVGGWGFAFQFDVRDMLSALDGWSLHLGVFIRAASWHLVVAPLCFLLMRNSLRSFTFAYGGSEKWLKAWWDRNVDGYNAWFWIRVDGGVNPDVGILVTRRNVQFRVLRPFDSVGTVFLSVPLGGWFRWNKRVRNGLYLVESYGTARVWRVRVDQPVAHFANSHHPCIEVIDDFGDKVSLTVSGAMQFIHENHGGVGGSQEWRNAVPRFVRLLRETRQTLVSERRHTETLRQQVAHLQEAFQRVSAAQAQDQNGVFLLLEEIIQRLDASKRYIKSKQAQALRVWLVERLLVLLPPNDPRRNRYAPNQVAPGSDQGTA